MPNEHNQAMPASVAAEIQTHLDAIKRLAEPYLTPRTAKQRKTMPRMADKTVAFVQKTAAYAASNPAFVPPFVDVKEIQTDVAGVTTLTPLRQQLEQLATDFDSTVMVAGSEAYTGTLVIYANIKFLAKNNQPGAEAAYLELKVRFPGSSNAGRKPNPPSA